MKNVFQFWIGVKLCYEVVGSDLQLVNVTKEIPQRNYFPFYDYEYYLDVTKQKIVLVNTTSLSVGLQKSYDWYKNNKEKVNKKNYFDFIDNIL